MNAPRDQLLAFFRELFLGDDVVELRILKRTIKGGKEGTSSVCHHFSAKDLEAFISKAEWYNRKARAGEFPVHGIYFTVHALKPEMLKASRFANDGDVRSFKVLFHDLDVFLDDKKLKGSIEEYTVEWNGEKIVLAKSWYLEHRELGDRFLEWLAGELIRVFREELDWEVWAVVKSGFGLHFYEKFGFVWPADERAQDYKQLFDAVREFLLDKLQELLGINRGVAAEIVDEKVYNPSRIVRFPGSVNGKKAYVVEDGEIRFYPERLVEGAFIYFDPEAVLTESQVEEFLKRVKRVRKARIPTQALASEVSVGGELGLYYEDLWKARDEFQEAWALPGLDLPKESIKEIVSRLVFFYFEGSRNEMFLKLPNFFLARGLSGRTVIRIFDQLLKVGVELGLEDEGEIKGSRIIPVLRTIANFAKLKRGEQVDAKLGWRSFFFELPNDQAEYEELMQSLRRLWEVQNPRLLREKLGVWRQQLEVLELKDDIVTGVKTLLADSPSVAKKYLGLTVEELSKRPWEEQKAIVKEFVIRVLLSILAEIEAVKRFARTSRSVPQQVDEKIEQKLKEDAEKWERVKEKLGLEKEVVVIDFQFREGKDFRVLRILGSDPLPPIWNPAPELVEKLADSVPAVVAIQSEISVKPIDLETLWNMATWQDFDLPFVILKGNLKISRNGKLYLETGQRTYFFLDTYNAKRLERILRRNRVQGVPVELVAAVLEEEGTGQIYAVVADFEKVKEAAKEKRKQIEELIKTKDETVPDTLLRWSDLEEKARLDIAKHYLKLAIIYGDSPIFLLDESLNHHPKVFVARKPEGRKKFVLEFNRRLLEDFLRDLGFEEPDRAIIASELVVRILAKFPQLEEALSDLIIEAIEPYLAPGHKKFSEDTGEFRDIGVMRVPECIKAMLSHFDELCEEHIRLLAHYIKYYSKGLPTPPSEDVVRKGKRFDRRLALWELLVKYLASTERKEWYLKTFRKYYQKAKPPFTCPRKQGGACPFLELHAQLPKCPFVAPINKVERYIAWIDKVEIHGSDAIVIYFGDSRKVLDGIDVESKSTVEAFRSWLVATFGEEFTKAQAYQILRGLIDRATIVESEFSEELDIADQFATWVAEIAKRGILPWEARHAKALFFDQTKQVVYIPNPLFMSFLGMLGRTSKKGIVKHLRQALGRYLVSMNKRLEVPDGPNSQTIVKPGLIVIRREYFEKELGLELKEKGVVEQAIQEIPPEEDEE